MPLPGVSVAVGLGVDTGDVDLRTDPGDEATATRRELDALWARARAEDRWRGKTQEDFLEFRAEARREAGRLRADLTELAVGSLGLKWWGLGLVVAGTLLSGWSLFLAERR